MRLNRNWTGDWMLLWRIDANRPCPSLRVAPGAKAVVFDIEEPAGRWKEILEEEPTVLSNPSYKSSSRTKAVSGMIG